MFTINNTKIISSAINSLLLLSTLALGVMLAPIEAKALGYGGNLYYAGEENNFAPNPYGYTYPYYQPNYYQNPVTVYVQTPVYVETPPAPTPTIYSNSVNPNPAPKATAKTAATAKTKTTEDFGNLTASAVLGSDGFLPSGLIEWLFFAVIILGAVLLVRKIYGGSESYYATPLKHN